MPGLACRLFYLFHTAHMYVCTRRILEPQRSWWIHLITHIVKSSNYSHRHWLYIKMLPLTSFTTYLCGISSPPSTAPFMTANTRFPVVVRVSPTSRKQRNGRGPPPSASTLYSSPVGSVTPSYLSPRLNLAKIWWEVTERGGKGKGEGGRKKKNNGGGDRVTD